MEVVRTNHEPVFSGDEATGADRDVSDLEGLDESLSLVGPDVDMACRLSVISAPPSETSWGWVLPLYKVLRIHGSVGWKSIPFTRSERAKSCL